MPDETKTVHIDTTNLSMGTIRSLLACLQYRRSAEKADIEDWNQKELHSNVFLASNAKKDMKDKLNALIIEERKLAKLIPGA